MKYVWTNPNSEEKPSHCFRLSFFIFAVSSRVFVVEQFGIWRWKANKKTNLMILKHLKIGRLQPEKLLNAFEGIQIVKKSWVYSVQYVLSNPNTLLLTSRGLACKVQKLVHTLNLTQEPKNAMRLAWRKTPKRATWVRVKGTVSQDFPFHFRILFVSGGVTFVFFRLYI